MNGDDIFTTFATMGDENKVMWWYNRAYLYIFVSLFIYVILSVFIAVIMDTYETIKVCMPGSLFRFAQINLPKHSEDGSRKQPTLCETGRSTELK
jgi:hypothetical protein